MEFKVKNLNDGTELRIFQTCITNEHNLRFLGLDKDNKIIHGDFQEIMKDHKFVEFLEAKDFKR